MTDSVAESGVTLLELKEARQHHTIVPHRRGQGELRRQASDGTPIANAAVELCQACLGPVDLDDRCVAFFASSRSLAAVRLKRHIAPRLLDNNICQS